jgi:hypothetical protein
MSYKIIILLFVISPLYLFGQEINYEGYKPCVECFLANSDNNQSTSVREPHIEKTRNGIDRDRVNNQINQEWTKTKRVVVGTAVLLGTAILLSRTNSIMVQ